MAINARIALKHSTEVDWQKAINFIPLAGEIIIYDADANNPVRYKIGDGTTNVNALPFATGTAVLYTSQALTNEQKEQARTNIGAISVADIPEVPVTSVAGKTGAVTLTKSDVGLSNVTNESKATMFTSPVFTGTPTAPTAENTVDNTQVATTAFVHNVVNAISAADLGLEQAMKFLGTTTTDISDASNIDTIIIGSGTVKVEAGNVVLYNGYEYVWTGSAWEQLGQEGSFVLKSTTINGKALNNNITLTAGDVDAYTKAEVDTAFDTKVDKVEGKGLSTNDYTTDEKNKLAGIAVGATANIGTITEVIGGNGLTGSATSGAVTLAVGQGAGITVSENEISNAGVRSITQDGTDGHKLTINTGGTNTTITIPDNDTIYNEATTSVAGLMSATDKATFDSIPTTYATKAEVPTIEIVRW